MKTERTPSEQWTLQKISLHSSELRSAPTPALTHKQIRRVCVRANGRHIIHPHGVYVVVACIEHVRFSLAFNIQQVVLRPITRVHGKYTRGSLFMCFQLFISICFIFLFSFSCFISLQCNVVEISLAVNSRL